MNKNKLTLGILFFLLFSSSILLQACRIESRGRIDESLNVLHEKTFNISPGKLLKLDAASGDVIVRTWDKPQVYVKILGNSRAERKVDFSFDATDKSSLITHTTFLTGLEMVLE